MHHDVVHALQHFAFVACGFNMWMALLGPLPKPLWFGNFARLGYILAVRLTGAVLGNVFVFGGHVFFGVYAAGERAHGISPGADQNTAGAIMMVEGSILTLLLFGWLFARTAREGEERQELLERCFARVDHLDLVVLGGEIEPQAFGEMLLVLDDEAAWKRAWAYKDIGRVTSAAPRSSGPASSTASRAASNAPTPSRSPSPTNRSISSTPGA